MTHPTISAPDLAVYLVIDPTLTPDGQFDTVLHQACLGGVTMVQLRCKDSDTAPFVSYAQTAQRICHAHAVPFLINDRIDVALAVGADGVHIGQDDMPVALARKLLGDDKIIGLTIRTEPEAENCPTDLIEYASVGAVFATNSKTVTTPHVGLGGLSHLAGIMRTQRPNLPVCAISGITADNAGDVVRAGVDGVSVITAITQAPCPKTATETLKQAVHHAQ